MSEVVANGLFKPDAPRAETVGLARREPVSWPLATAVIVTVSAGFWYGLTVLVLALV
jgi:hypothetical protein